MLIQANSLFLVYPPISNQEGDWLYRVPEVRDMAAQSKLYMIGQRAELFFENHRIDSDSHTLHFDLRQADHNEGAPVVLPVDPLLNDYEGTIEIELGPKLIRIWADGAPPDTEPLAWFTPDKLLFDITHDRVQTETAVDVRILTEFDLLYVGISKAGDSFTRLFATGHEARLKILSNEHQRAPTSRVTDEMVLFLFDIERFGVGVYDFDKLPERLGVDFRAELESVVADAEKAFVNLLAPKYNEIKYVNYPRGADGLYGGPLERYGYAIREDLQLRAGAAHIRGGTREGDYDVILIEGDEVTIVRHDT